MSLDYDTTELASVLDQLHGSFQAELKQVRTIPIHPPTVTA